MFTKEDINQLQIAIIQRISRHPCRQAAPKKDENGLASKSFLRLAKKGRRILVPRARAVDRPQQLWCTSDCCSISCGSTKDRLLHYVAAPAPFYTAVEGGNRMEIVYSHCCGLDVHKKNVVACVLTPEGKEIRTFATLTDDLLLLMDWLKSKKCTVVAMESTASFWKPLFNLLELEEIQPLVVNAQHIRNVPGRKTDVKDAEWIASLLRHGLLKGSYIPTREHRELRELIRYRRSLIEERAREANRIQKVLEGANIKLSSVIRDVLGKSGRAMLEAMIAGEEDPVVLSGFAQKRMKSKKAELQRAFARPDGSSPKTNATNPA